LEIQSQNEKVRERHTTEAGTYYEGKKTEMGWEYLGDRQ